MEHEILDRPDRQRIENHFIWRFLVFTYRIELSIAVSQRVIGYLVNHDIIGIDWNKVMSNVPVNPPLG